MVARYTDAGVADSTFNHGAALIDSLEYAIWKSGAELRRRDERALDPVAAVSPAARRS